MLGWVVKRNQVKEVGSPEACRRQAAVCVLGWGGGAVPLSPLQGTLSGLLPSWMQKVVLVPGPAQTPGTDPQGLLPRDTLYQVTFSNQARGGCPGLGIRVMVCPVQGSGGGGASFCPLSGPAGVRGDTLEGNWKGGEQEA